MKIRIPSRKICEKFHLKRKLLIKNCRREHLFRATFRKLKSLNFNENLQGSYILHAETHIIHWLTLGQSGS